jgi:DNA-binding GntR family transcriptional regulator
MEATLAPAGLKHKTMAESAADELRRRILSGEFPEGYQLKQEHLSNEFGISRIPLREALVQLENEGLVKILPHRGAIVSELSSEDITELFELRSLIEPFVLRKSIPKLTKSDFEEADRILAEYTKELHSKSASRWGELNTKLHLLLLSRASQPRTMGIVMSLLQQTDRYTRLELSLRTGSLDKAEEEHHELVKLCKIGDTRGAATLLKKHILQAAEDLKEFIASRRR